MNELVTNFDFIQKLIDAIFSEYGAFVAFLIVCLVVTYRSKEKTIERNDILTDKLLDTVQANTEAMAQLTAKIDVRNNEKGGSKR